MKVSEEFPSKFLKASDVPKPYSLKIQEVTKEQVDPNNGTDVKMVVHFAGAERGLVLNATNAKTMAAAYGDETAGWVGKPVELYAVETSYRGEAMMGLRLRVPSVSTEQTVPPAEPPPDPLPDEREHYDDDMPF